MRHPAPPAPPVPPAPVPVDVLELVVDVELFSFSQPNAAAVVPPTIAPSIQRRECTLLGSIIAKGLLERRSSPPAPDWCDRRAEVSCAPFRRICATRCRNRNRTTARSATVRERWTVSSSGGCAFRFTFGSQGVSAGKDMIGAKLFGVASGLVGLTLVLGGLELAVRRGYIGGRDGAFPRRHTEPSRMGPRPDLLVPRTARCRAAHEPRHRRLRSSYDRSAQVRARAWRSESVSSSSISKRSRPSRAYRRRCSSSSVSRSAISSATGRIAPSTAGASGRSMRCTIRPRRSIGSRRFAVTRSTSFSRGRRRSFRSASWVSRRRSLPASRRSSRSTRSSSTQTCGGRSGRSAMSSPRPRSTAGTTRLGARGTRQRTSPGFFPFGT